ncbi:MAG: Cof-type HAD-IIB family hydrolase [Micrococcaceae bacterium]
MIKAIAVDLDGTFLNPDSTYDKERFNKIYEQLVARDIKFLVASGSQYFRIKDFFPGKEQDITIISENGAVVIQNKKVLEVFGFDDELVKKLVAYLNNDKEDLEVLLCGVKAAYLLADSSEKFKKFVAHHYFGHAEVKSFDPLPDDDIVKLAMDLKPEIVGKIVDQLNLDFPDELRAVSSGFEYVDVLLPNVNKGRAIKALLTEWNIKPNELLAFGDADNDVEMLALTEHSYAMADSSDKAIRAAKHRARSNAESGVLTVIEQYLR